MDDSEPVSDTLPDIDDVTDAVALMEKELDADSVALGVTLYVPVSEDEMEGVELPVTVVDVVRVVDAVADSVSDTDVVTDTEGLRVSVTDREGDGDPVPLTLGVIVMVTDVEGVVVMVTDTDGVVDVVAEREAEADTVAENVADGLGVLLREGVTLIANTVPVHMPGAVLTTIVVAALFM